MTVSNNDILRITTFGQLFGETIINVDFRRYDDVGGSGNTYEELMQLYQAERTANWMPAICDSYTINRTLLENLTNGIEFLDDNTPSGGAKSQICMPSYVAVTVKLVRTTKVTRNGSKRLAGIAEVDVDQNAQGLPALQVTAIQDFFGLPLEERDVGVNDFDLTPIIVGRTLNVGTGVYELDLTRINDVQAAIVSPNISTQNTRKPLQGI